MLQIGLFNPVASIMLSHFERLESRYLSNSTSMLAVSKNGLWLRQADEGGQSAIYATRISQSDVTLQQVIFFLFEGRDTFIGRIDAESAKLEDGYWDIRKAWISAPNKAAPFCRDIPPAHRFDTGQNTRQLCVTRNHVILGPTCIH